MMIKDPDGSPSHYDHFFFEYGQFLACWNSFEVLVEIAIMRLLRLTVKENCILNGALGFAAKHHILCALLDPIADAERLKSVQDTNSLAERNGFVHGIVSVNPGFKTFTITKREVKGALSVKTKTLTAIAMQKHASQFFSNFVKVQDAFQISENDLILYQRDVECFAQVNQAPYNTLRQSQTSSSVTKRGRRRAQRAQTRAASSSKPDPHE